jgi:hypothetical protein
MTNAHKKLPQIVGLFRESVDEKLAGLKSIDIQIQHWNPSRNAQDALIITCSNMPALFQSVGPSWLSRRCCFEGREANVADE